MFFALKTALVNTGKEDSGQVYAIMLQMKLQKQQTVVRGFTGCSVALSHGKPSVGVNSEWFAASSG